ncbi:short chain dehydrogenase [anaerobic digester metagenome]
MARRENRVAIVTGASSGMGAAIAVAGDVSIEDDVQKVVRTTVERFGMLDIVVNNAGLLDNMAPLHEMDDAT